jgi:chorismate mutase/prephenate dehydratase
MARPLHELGNPVLSLHPMFGPTSPITGGHIIVVGDIPDERAEHLLDVLKRGGARLHQLSLDEHEREMKLLQALPHLLLMFNAYCMIDKGSIKNISMASPLMKIMHQLVSRMVEQNPSLYYHIVMELLKNQDWVEKSFNNFISMIKEKNEFKRVFSTIRDHSDRSISSELLQIVRLIDEPRDILEVRAQLEILDDLMVKLLSRRMELARKLAEMKKKLDQPVTNIEIEKNKINNIIRSNPHLSPVFLEKLFKLIIQWTKQVQFEQTGSMFTLAVLGPEGSFSEEAAIREVGTRLPLVYCRSIGEVFEKVENGEVTFGLVPVENSLEGIIGQTFDELVRRDVKVVGETSIRVSMCLAGKKKRRSGEGRDILTLYSHPVALAQCMSFVQSMLSDVEIQLTRSTSEAAEKVDENSVAITSRHGALMSGLDIIEEDIQDSRDNFTRFYLISKNGDNFDGGKITAMVFSVEDKPGSLLKVLEYFGKRGINMRLLVSRPSRNESGKYLFMVEVEEKVSIDDIKALERKASFLKVLGCFGNARECFQKVLKM